MAISMLATGVYCIRHIASGKRYIGSSSRSFRSRWDCHKSHLNTKIHHSSKLQNSWNKYGADAFEFIILCYCAPDECVEAEQWWIDYFDAYKNGFNCSPTAGSPRGVKHSAETVAKVVASLRGRPCSEETRAKRSASLKGRIFSDETREKMRDAHKRRKPATGETRSRMSISHRGKPIHTEESRAKISAANKRREQKPFSEEHRRKIGDAHRGRILSDETKAKMSAASMGKTMPRDGVEKAVATKLANRQAAKQLEAVSRATIAE